MSDCDDFSINHGVNIATGKKPIFNDNLTKIGDENYVKALFTDGNIADLKVSFLSPEERQIFKANVLYRKEKANGFPETLSMLVSLLPAYGGSATGDDPIETFDLSGFCTSESQALDFAMFALKTRKEVERCNPCDSVYPIIVFSTTQTHLGEWNPQIDKCFKFV